MGPKKAACKEFPNFKGFKFDQRQQEPRTANIQKFSSLGRRPLPQTPDEKARKQPPVPKVPTTICETPLNPANFRSLQRGAWQENTAGFHPGASSSMMHQQYRSLQRGTTTTTTTGAATAQNNITSSHSQFRSVKIQDQTHNEAVYANNETERQLYAVTEL